MGTPEFARYQLWSLLNHPEWNVVGVVTQPDRPAGRKMKPQPTPVKTLALEQGVPVLETSGSVDELIPILKSWKPDVALVVAFGKILSKNFLEEFRSLNIHASLLPRWRGAAPIQRAIMAGDTKTGVCLQIMTEQLDAGDIIGCREVDILPSMNACDLHDILMKKSPELFHEMKAYLEGKLRPKPQSSEGVTYASKIKKEEGEIDWSKENNQIFCQIRGLALGPGTFTFFRGKKLKIHRGEPVECVQELPGKVVAVTKDDFTVACGKGALRILEVQEASKKRMWVSEFLKGHNISVGDVLGGNKHV
ncbi:MAG: methionyl-tRNA formyltransferase [Bdellovibrio sp.]|nr:MAG: methionyl-tRNA formyltransferase [Bdellovibrio sp.]